ncbi:hypothetical protein BHAOGJBA_4265 [Methylobacterium hispanicum]|uniref:Uncharacterized protein n=1 Tax=Methylobacterium hispanicum TaxID=270350 RepID=A0AAV4ZS91_9HYPH|nr:hypothetical protein [Methylobacterium hispanicum]GJD90723.1 hypothetical protein BHAOGJBA_4265 [Methylobacterium hispanicum]
MAHVRSLIRALAATLAGAVVGVHVSAAVPALVFEGSFGDFLRMTAAVQLTALCTAVATAPLLARGLREDGPRRLAWQCALIGGMVVAGAEMRWMMFLDLSPTPTHFWSVVFNALLRGVPGGVVGAGMAMAILHCSAPRPKALA